MHASRVVLEIFIIEQFNEASVWMVFRGEFNKVHENHVAYFWHSRAIVNDTAPDSNSFSLNRTPKEDRVRSRAPTFAEFSNWVANPNPRNRRDVHQREIFGGNCRFCRVHYDVVGKIETAKEDFEYIMEKTGIGRKVGRKMLRRNPATANTTRLALEYFSTLTPKEAK